MKGLFESMTGSGQDPMPQVSIEDINFAKANRMVRLALLAVFLIVCWMGVTWGRTFYTDWLWFSQLGYESVLLKKISTQIWLFLLGAAVFAVMAIPNLFAAFRISNGLPFQPGQPLPQETHEAARKLVIWVTWGATAVAGIFLASNPPAEWERILRFLSGVAFQETDPIFQKDFSFYIFSLPVLGFARSWLLKAVVATMAIVAAYYYIAALLRGERFSLTGKVKSHLALLGALLLILLAVGHWLGRYELLYSPTGAVYGVGYTDAHVTLPARTAMTFVALACSGLLLVSLFSRARHLILLSVAIYVGLNLLAGSVLPILVQRLVVEPSELARERPYLTHNIELTRRAYGLERLQSRSHPALGEIRPDIVAENQGTLRNVRLWDEGPLLQSYNQIQFFRLYYDFLSVHTDRYWVDDELRQVMLATRELSAEKLPAEAQRWVNRHLQFTHGYGVAMSPVTEVEAGGRPSFFVRDLPPKGQIALERPDIYYGLKSLDYLIVRTQMQEFNYPGQDGPVYTRYEGQGGVQLSSFFRKLVYAWQFMDINILISGEIQPDSLIQYRRTIAQRFSTITPFLMRDREAYSVVADGRLFWIQDAYTATNRYPYSTPWHGYFDLEAERAVGPHNQARPRERPTAPINYLRNSVKAVVDAYHGHVDYYISDADDPIIRTYQAIFPSLFKPMEEMPSYLRQHIRYPLDQFTVQTQMLLQYHMVDPTVFYNKEDQWAIPVQASFGATEALKPYYIVARLPGSMTEEFLLIQPFTPINRHNLVGWMAARNDKEHYGELVLFRFPTGRHVDGPNQVEARIDNDVVISEQFTLWGQMGSQVFRGILLVIPLGDALLYAEPVFLKPDSLEFPELRRIILADSRQVVMHQNLDASVAALVGHLPAVAPIAALIEDEPLPLTPAPGVPGPGLDPDALRNLGQGLQEAVDKLQQVLDQIKRMVP